jgi:N-methylhydantoinase B
MPVNATDLAIISQALIAAAREMGAKLIRSAFSTLVREASDASAAILDPKGQVIAQAELIPLQLGSLAATFGSCAELYPPETLEEGDFYINNDPYHGGQHLPDVFIFSPIFFRKRLIGFAATVAHHIDIGGGAPGLNMTARELFQEGLIFPPGRYNLQRDWNGGPLERFIAANVRVPDQTIGDFYAQFAGNSTGAARVQQLCRKYGQETVARTMAELLNYSERRMRAAIAEVPDGTFRGEDWIDDDGDGGAPIPIKAAVIVKGDSLAVDFAGSHPQVETNLNSPFASTVASAYSCIKAVLTGPELPFNGGNSRPITVSAPYGSILNPRPPAPVRARMTSSYRAFNAVMKALAQAVPDKVIAAGFDTTTGPYLSRRGENGYRVYHEVIGGGYGASGHKDGCSGVAGPIGNCSNTPVESLDMDFDFLRVREYGLLPDSGGHGRFRGGLGIRRVYEITKADVQFAQYGDRYRLRPEGLYGGAPGAAASCWIVRNGKKIRVKSKDWGMLQAGDRLILQTGGGAGYGSPVHRSRDGVDRDISEVWISKETARKVYGPGRRGRKKKPRAAGGG